MQPVILMRKYPLLGVWLGALAFPLFYCLNRLPSRPRTRGLLIRGDKVLIVRNWLGAQQWTLPGGGVKRGESELDGLAREIHEEVGYTIDSSKARFLATVLLKSNRNPFQVSVYAYELADTSPETILSAEILDAEWVRIRDLPIGFTPEIRNILLQHFPKA